MITQFLTHLEFCHEVSDPEVIELISKQERASTVPVTHDPTSVHPEIPERYVFFPALVNVETPGTQLWNQDIRFSYQCGWILQCSQPEHFFTPRFLQVLLLRLAFSFALIPDSRDYPVDFPVLQRECSIWKNGIYWVNLAGVASLIEVDEDARKLIVIMRCLNGCELKCIKLRSAIIQKVLKAAKDFCPKVLTTVHLIHPSSIQYPLPPIRELAMFSIHRVAQAVVQSEPAVVSDDRRLATIEELLYFEPYADIGETIIAQLFDEQNPCYSEVVSDSFLYAIADKAHPKQSLFRKMLDLPASSVEFHQSQAPPGPAHAMGHLLVCWKERSDGSRQCLRQKLDQFSIFAGRNPLVSQTVSNSTIVFFSVISLNVVVLLVIN